MEIQRKYKYVGMEIWEIGVLSLSLSLDLFILHRKDTGVSRYLTLGAHLNFLQGRVGYGNREPTLRPWQPTI